MTCAVAVSVTVTQEQERDSFMPAVPPAACCHTETDGGTGLLPVPCVLTAVPTLGFDGVIHLRQQYAACEQEVHCEHMLGAQCGALLCVTFL